MKPQPNKIIVFAIVFYALSFAKQVYADGVISINPYLSTSIAHDDNIFRLSSTQNAQTVLGTDSASDVIKRLEVGGDVKVNLSRQILTLSSSFNETSYDNFDFLDNTAKSNKLLWNWFIGNNFNGEISTSHETSLAGFTNLRNTTRNIRTVSTQSAIANWTIHPEWTLFASVNQSESESELIFATGNITDTNSYQTGIRFDKASGSSIALSYFVRNTEFPNRTNIVIGDSNELKSIQVNASWIPSFKTRLNASLSTIDVGYERFSQLDVSGTNKRVGLSYILTDKINFNITGYQEISPINDFFSTFIKVEGFTFSPVWNVSSKLSLRGNLGNEKRNFLGDAGFFSTTSEGQTDETFTKNLVLSYLPTDKSILRLEYQGDNRKSNFTNVGYRFNNFNIYFKYNY